MTLSGDATPSAPSPHLTAPPPPWMPRNWDEIRAALPPESLAMRLDGLPLPTRIESFAGRQGWQTLGDLAARSRAELLAERNVGRLSVHQMFVAVRRAHADVPLMAPAARAALAAAQPDEVRLAAERARREEGRRLADLGFLASLRALMADLEPSQRMTLSLRAGLDGPPRLQKDVGRDLGGCRLRALKREKKVIARLSRERDWLDAVRSRLDATLGARAHALTTLAADPWWAGIAEVPWVLDYLGSRLLGGHLHVFVLAGEIHVASWPASALDAPWEDLRRRAEETPLPAPLATFEALAEPVGERLGPGARDELLGRLRPLLHVEDLGSGPLVTLVCRPSTATDRRLRRRRALVTILRERGEPAPLDDLRAALSPELRANVLRLDRYLERPPFIRCDAERYGLRDRDVPGGAKALAAAAERVAAELASTSGWRLLRAAETSRRAAETSRRAAGSSRRAAGSSRS